MKLSFLVPDEWLVPDTRKYSVVHLVDWDAHALQPGLTCGFLLPHEASDSHSSSSTCLGQQPAMQDMTDLPSKFLSVHHATLGWQPLHNVVSVPARQQAHPVRVFMSMAEDSVCKTMGVSSDSVMSG